jgi:tetraacyldisaccharide-1-P 4'-kinase
LPAGATVLLASAIARPASFEATVQSLGFAIAGHLRFPDHYPYPEESRQKITAAWKALRAAALRAQAPPPAALLVTSKDRVKLAGRLPAGIPLAELPIRAELVAPFWDWLDTRKI